MTRSRSSSSSSSSSSPHHSDRHPAPRQRSRGRTEARSPHRRQNSRSSPASRQRSRGRTKARSPRPREHSRSSPQRERAPTHSSRSSRENGEDDTFNYKDAYHILLADTRKRKRAGAAPKNSAQAQGRGVRKTAALFGEICHIIAEAQAYERHPIPDDHGIDDHERNYQAYLEIDRLIPGLAGKIAKMDADEKADHFTLLQKGANDARSDDFRRISSLVGTWINEDRDKPELDAFNYLPSIVVTNDQTGEPTGKEVKQYPPLLRLAARRPSVLNFVTLGVPSVRLAAKEITDPQPPST
ncbi:hypothetical protein B0H10DRAFT_2230066 [Mycena sp. CBHHK59/15]|nr:hypothetical protein B0H10DRAFT_2230066 [Mycena sp. CBHHK59/15]